MKKIIFLSCILSLSCTKKIEVLINDQVSTIEVERVSVKESIVSSEPKTEVSETEKCTYSGICLNCGLNYGLKYKCGLSYFLHCGGTRSVKYVPQIEKYQDVFTTEKGTFNSPIKSRTIKKYTHEETCH
jgi:hypothetical protein